LRKKETDTHTHTQRDTQTDNKGHLKLAAREPLYSKCALCTRLNVLISHQPPRHSAHAKTIHFRSLFYGEFWCACALVYPFLRISVLSERRRRPTLVHLTS